MEKPVILSTLVSLPQGHQARDLTFSNGRFQITDASGREVVPTSVQRVLYHERAKGPKIRSVVTLKDLLTSVGGVQEWASFDSVVVTDTNTLLIDNRKVSVTAFIHLKFSAWHNGAIVTVIGDRMNYIKMLDPVGNPELLAIHKIATDITEWIGYGATSNIAIVTDTELGAHERINVRQSSLFGPFMLPNGFSIHYASSDSAKEVINVLIRHCDKYASKLLDETGLTGEDVEKSIPMPSAPGVRYRMAYVEATLEPSYIEGLTLGPEATLSIYGVPKNSDRPEIPSLELLKENVSI